MQVLFTEGVSTTLSSAAGASLLVFSLLYTPCVAAITAIRQELGISWATAVAVWQCVLAWIAACGVYWIGVAMGGM